MTATYYADCTGIAPAEVPALNRMIEAERSIGYATFRKAVGPEALDAWARARGYSVGAERGLHLKSDWAVSYYRSRFKGRPCVHLRWSAIESIWILEGDK
jgi:hypothetical protein